MEGRFRENVQADVESGNESFADVLEKCQDSLARPIGKLNRFRDMITEVKQKTRAGEISPDVRLLSSLLEETGVLSVVSAEINIIFEQIYENLSKLYIEKILS